MFTIPSSPVTPLQKAQAVLNSLGTQDPLYLGRGFSLSKDPAKEIPFFELLAGCNKNHPDYQQLEFTLKTIEQQRNISKVRPSHHITTAVSSVLPVMPTSYALPPAPMATFPSYSHSATNSVAMQPSSKSLAPSTQISDRATFFPIRYDDRVKLWFNNPSEALAKPKYQHLSSYPAVQERVIWVHAFSLNVDAYVDEPTFGSIKVWNGTDRMFYIPAEVNYNGTTTRGGFQYTFSNKDGKCYHRAWGEKSNPVIKGIWDKVNFKEEESETKLPSSQETVNEFFSRGIDYDPRLGSMTFTDEEHPHVQITLFPMWNIKDHK